MKPNFDDIFTPQYLYQKFLESDTIVEIIVGGWLLSFFSETV